MKMNNTYKPLFVLVCMAMFVCGPSLWADNRNYLIGSSCEQEGRIEQFLPAEQTDNASQRYIKLQDWAKNFYRQPFFGYTIRRQSTKCYREFES